MSGVKATEIDRVLHAERLEGRGKRLHALDGALEALPNGAMVEAGGESYLIAHGRAWRWAFAGYTALDDVLHDAKLLTPPSTLRAFRAGYKPVLHPSAVS